METPEERKQLVAGDPPAEAAPQQARGELEQIAHTDPDPEVVQPAIDDEDGE